MAIGKNIQKDFSRGEKLLREAISDGDKQAKRVLGKILLKEETNQSVVDDGVALIQDAAQDGDESAMLSFAEMLFEGKLLQKDEKEGRRLLRKLVQLENSAGTMDLAERLLYGKGVDKDFQEAVKLIARLLDMGEGGAGLLLGRYYYENNNMEMATVYMKKGVELHSENAKNNYSFMIRRGEAFEYAGIPTIDDLLLEHVEKNELYATINYALCIANGFQCEKNWNKADEMCASLLKSEDPVIDALVWWHEFLISKNDDPEGHLVVGWLVRHKFIEDPDNMTVSQRMAKARSGGWDVPDWMDSVV